MSGFVWRPGVQREGDCRLLRVEGVDDTFELSFGVPRSSGWPSDVICRMDPDWPKDIALSDSPAGAGLLLVSAGLQQHLAGLGVNDCEFLPVTIMNHKRRVASREYYIVNPLGFCDCIDMQASGVSWNDISGNTLCGCRYLVLKWGMVPAGRKIFRLQHWPNVTVMRTEIAEALLSAGWSGLHFIDPMKYTGVV